MPQFSGLNIVVLTGAGISAESGLRTFRDADGLWEGHHIEEVATPEAFARNPSLVHSFYNQRRRQLREVLPNQAHAALAQFESQHKGNFLLVTQNVDDLHQRAGSKNIIPMHGELNKVRCQDSGEIFPWLEDLDIDTTHPNNPLKQGRLRPHICWFGEMPFFMDEIQEAVSQADLFVAIGTSGVVYPAAGLVDLAPRRCRKVIINKDFSENSSRFSEQLIGSATNEVPKFFFA